MRRTAAALAAAAVLALAGPADARSYGQAAGAKLVHALADIVYAPFELVVTPVAWSLDFEREEERAMPGLVAGLVPGAGLGALRLVRGVSDLITFPIASPDNDYDLEWFIVPPRPLSGFEEQD